MSTTEQLSRDSRLWLDQLENIVAISADYTVREQDDLVRVDSTAGAVILTLPRAINGRKIVAIRTGGSNNVTLTPVGSDTVNGAASLIIAGSWFPVALKAHNGTWLTNPLLSAGTGIALTYAAGSVTVAQTANSVVQKVEVAKNSGAVVATRKQLNFIEGTGVTLTVTDDAGNDQADITIAQTANSVVQKVEIVKNSGSVVGTRKQLNFIEGTGITLTVTDDAGNDQLDITISATPIWLPTKQVFDTTLGDGGNFPGGFYSSGDASWSTVTATGTFPSFGFLAGQTGGNGYVIPFATSYATASWSAAKNPIYAVRMKDKATAGTRYWGFFASIAPANGIYFRHTLSGNLIAVCRASSTETAYDTGIAASTTIERELDIVVTGGGTSAEFFVDGASVRTITTNIPSAAMMAGHGYSAANSQVYIGHMHIEQEL